MTDAELIAWCKSLSRHIKGRQRDGVDVVTADKHDAETLDSIAARLAQPTAESVAALADETIDALVERLNMSVKTPIPKPKCECKVCRKVSEYRKAREVQK